MEKNHKIQFINGGYIVDRGFIRLPPDETDLEEAQKNPLFVEFSEVKPGEPLIGGLIAYRDNQFAESGNPVLAFEAFFHSIENGVYPPTNVLRWMAEILRKYHHDQGTKSLDQYFGTSRGRGQRTTEYEKLLLETRDGTRLGEMDCLMYLGASREAAAEMVARKMKTEDWNKTAYEMKDLSPETLIDMHKRSRRPVLDEVTAEMLWGIDGPEAVKRFLSLFPPDTVQRFASQLRAVDPRHDRGAK